MRVCARYVHSLTVCLAGKADGSNQERALVLAYVSARHCAPAFCHVSQAEPGFGVFMLRIMLCFPFPGPPRSIHILHSCALRFHAS
jgi:hypothetical protein